MSRVTITRSVDVVETPRVMQVLGMFDVPPSRRSEQAWSFEFELPEAWNVGLIVGPSGAGKSTAARELFGGRLVESWPWPADRSVLDGFPAAMGIRDVTELLSSVGFSTPPAWLRPFHALSNGEQFRVNLARTLAESPDLAAVDEFTSVVDRQVAKVGSAAVAKAVRRRGQKFVAVSCHYDILEWLDPDWVLQPHLGSLERRCLQGRPKLELEVHQADRGAWALFKPHHYLSGALHTASTAFVACLGGRPVAFDSYLHLPHPRVRDIKIGHRLVVLPDYQGLGIGARFEEWLGEHLHARGFRYRNVTAHPALVAACLKSPRWRLTGSSHGVTSRPKKVTSKHTGVLMRKQGRARRLATRSFEYVPVRKAV
jgi:ABC-type ATPase involved in cell division/GNAT superfamily N-acetyltransferase